MKYRRRVILCQGNLGHKRRYANDRFRNTPRLLQPSFYLTYKSKIPIVPRIKSNFLSINNGKTVFFVKDFARFDFGHIRKKDIMVIDDNMLNFMPLGRMK